MNASSRSGRLSFWFGLLLLLPQMAAAETFIVTVSDNVFTPENLTIQVGDTVEWRNAAGGMEHNVTSNNDSNTSFSSITSNNFIFAFTFNSPGENPYRCTIHGPMRGSITVEGTASAAELVMTEVNAPSGSYQQGSSISITAEVENTGNAASGSYSVDYYASATTVVTNSDRLLGTQNRSSLEAGEDASPVFVATIPTDLAAGMYFIVAIVNFQDGTSDNNSNFEDTAITVTILVSSGIPFNPGQNGTWYGGPTRAGEGAQIEIVDGGNGTQLLVATVFSYDSLGNQIFMIMFGTAAGDTVDVDVFITVDGFWGDAFNPDLIMETQWGTGRFTSLGCEMIDMELTPNLDYQALDYTALHYILTRLTTSLIPCPYP